MNLGANSVPGFLNSLFCSLVALSVKRCLVGPQDGRWIMSLPSICPTFTAHSVVIHVGRFLNPIGCSLHHALAIPLDMPDMQVNPCAIPRLYSCRAFRLDF